MPGAGRDAWGGWTLPILQQWWGHRAAKSTFLYIVGIDPQDVPPIPYVMGEPTHVIAASRNRQKLRLVPEVSKAEREHTPPDLARWLVALAARCDVTRLETA